MADLTPHDLVTGLAKELAAAKVDALASLPGNASAATRANALASADELPELIIFAGYLGGEVARAADSERKWRLLYLDWKLVSWLLIPEQDIVFSTQIDDPTAPFKRRDALWVNANALVKRGTGPQSVEARFLRGDFVRAGDISTSLTGGTFTPTTGIFCEATTPQCCGKPTRR